MNKRDILLEAADLLEGEGVWLKGVYKAYGRFCMVGALAQISGLPVSRVEEEFHPVLNLVPDVAKFEFPYQFNDAAESVAEVTAAMRKAAELVDE